MASAASVRSDDAGDADDAKIGYILLDRGAVNKRTEAKTKPVAPRFHFEPISKCSDLE
jgi:hypothetical protein